MVLLLCVSVRLVTPTCLFVASIGCAVSAQAAASDESKRAFDLPRGDAATILRQFAAICGRQVFFMMDKVKGEQTNAVAGKFSPREALDRMLSGTSLVALQDEVTGNFVISRRNASAPRPELERDPKSQLPSAREPTPSTTSVGGNPAAAKSTSTHPPGMKSSSMFSRLAAALVLLVAPAADAAERTSDRANDETVVLSDFEVRATVDDDYKAANVISGTRFATKLMDLPRQIDVITDTFLNDLGVVDVQEALRYNSSIQLDSAEGVEVEEPQIVIRGYRADTTYVNGFAIAQSIDRLFVDRVEIIKGPSSIFSGPIEPGGTINTITKKPSTRRGGTLAFSAGSFDKYRAEASYNTPLNASKTLTTRVAAALEDHGSQLEFAGRRRTILGAGLQWRPTARTTVLAEVRYMGTHQEPGDPTAYVDPSVAYIVRNIRPEFNRAGPDAYYKLYQWQANAEITHTFNDHWSFRAGVLGTRREIEQLTINGSSTVIAVAAATGIRTVARVPVYRPDDHGFSVSPQTQLMGKFRYGGIDHKFLVGAEAAYSQNRTLTRSLTAGLPRIAIDTPQPASAYSFGDPLAYPITANTESWSRTYGVPVNNLLTLFRGRLVLLNGMRYGYVNNDGRNFRTSTYNPPFTQSAVVSGHGVTYILLPGRLSAFASYAESFVPLTGTDWQGNSFDPVEGSGLDYGIKFDLLDGRLSGTITGYRTIRDKALARDLDHSGFFVQERKQRSQGLEAGLQLRPLRDWQVLFNYGYCDIVTTGDPQAVVNNTRQRNVPTHQGSVWNRYRFSEGRLKGLSLGVGVIRLGNRRGNDTRLDIPGLQLWPFTKVDASLGYDFRILGRRATFQLSGHNLLDRQFIDHFRYYAAPRGFTSSLRLNF